MRGLKENHDTVEGIIYASPAEWGPDDAYSLYRFFTHALYKACSSKNGYYLFKILVADVLSFSDHFDRHISALLM